MQWCDITYDKVQFVTLAVIYNPLIDPPATWNWKDNDVGQWASAIHLIKASEPVDCP